MCLMLSVCYISLLSNVPTAVSYKPLASPEDNMPWLKRIDDAIVINDYYYFYNLKRNFGENASGICTYVGSQMFLQYLDFRWRDDIIDYGFEKRVVGNSTSIETFSESFGSYNEVDNPDKPQFLNYLINFGGKIGYSPKGLTFNPVFNSSQICSFIEAYLDTKNIENDKDYRKICLSTYTGSYTVYDHIVRQIRSGFPLIVSTAEHTFIAYGYIPNTKKLLVHNGWFEHSKDIFDYSSSQIYDVHTLYFTGHEHSYKYENSEKYFCSCGHEKSKKCEHDVVPELTGYRPARKIYRCIKCTKWWYSLSEVENEN